MAGERPVNFGPRTGAKLLRMACGEAGKALAASVRMTPPNAAAGTSIYRFTLLEDTNGAAEGIYKADISSLNGTAFDDDADLIDTFGWMSALQLRAGDFGLCVKDEDQYYFLVSDCGSIGDCTDGPFLSAQTPSTATVGDAYAWTPTATGTNTPDTWVAAGLPAGLSVDTSTGEITGTPTTAGEYLVTLTASKEECDATKIVTITVEEASP